MIQTIPLSLETIEATGYRTNENTSLEEVLDYKVTFTLKVATNDSQKNTKETIER